MRKYSRYQDTPASIQSQFDLKVKEVNPYKPLTSSFIQKNPESDLLRLPALGSMKRSFSISST